MVMVRKPARLHTMAWCVGIILCGAALGTTGEVWARTAQDATPRLSARAVDSAVIAALPTWHAQPAQVIRHLDLSRPFATRSQWTLVVAREAGPPSYEFTYTRPVYVCFVQRRAPHCVTTFPDERNIRPTYRSTYHLLGAKVVDARHTGSGPLLLLKTASWYAVDGGHIIRTALYAYDRKSDAFRAVFAGTTGSNNNQATRLVTRGPVRGDVIVDYPTQRAPYTYWIEVYAPGKSGKYARTLRYRGHTGYNDHNPLAVADSEMPAILHRLGLWQHGDPLPIPRYKPRGCTHFVLRRHEEWCKPR